MQRIARSFRLFKQSWGVLMLDKELLVLPLLSGFLILLVTASFVVPMGLLTGGEVQEDNPWLWVAVLAFYIVTYTIGIFFQAAVISGATERMKGGDPTLGSALGAAGRHFGRILVWGVIAGTVGMVLKSIQERSEIIGRIVVAIVGVAWSLATFFVVPVLVLEEASVRDGFKRSWALIKQTWGEAVVGQAGIGIATFLLSLPVFAVGGLLLAAHLTIVGIAFLVLAVALLAMVSSALQGVYVAALYRYATQGEAPAGFAGDDIAGAFAAKKGRRQ